MNPLTFLAALERCLNDAGVKTEAGAGVAANGVYASRSEVQSVER
jgi:hypothetical protein